MACPAAREQGQMMVLTKSKFHYMKYLALKVLDLPYVLSGLAFKFDVDLTAGNGSAQLLV